MNAHLKFAVAALCGMLLGLPAAHSDDDFPATNLYIELGTTEGDLVVFPRDIKLQVGELYRLALTNPSPYHHVMIAPEFAATVLTAGISRLVQGVDLPYASIGAGINMPAGEMMQIYFLPFKEGRFKLFCEDRSHTTAGMEVTIDVVL